MDIVPDFICLYSPTSFIQTLLIRMIRNVDTCSWELTFLVLFLLLNLDVSVSESEQAGF